MTLCPLAEIDVAQQIRDALESADAKGKLGLVAVLTGVERDRLADIVDGGDMDVRERIILATYLDGG